MDVDDVDQRQGSDPPDFAQTREVNVPVDDDDENSTPENYADIDPVDTIDLTKDDDEAEGWCLDGGTTLAMNKASRGPIYLNSYGYKSCAITVWESAQAERTVGKLTNIRGDPHKKALETNEEGDYIHRGKIKKILNVAWKPKRKIWSIEDLLASVEELNPKTSTVLSKASNERTDRKFYQIGLLQVKRYREILLGDRRNLGDLERTPPGLTESPEPGESNAVCGDTASQPASNTGQAQGAQNEGGRTSSGDPRGRNPSSQNPSSQNTGSQGQASPHPDNQNQGDQNRGDQTQESPSHGNKPRTMRSFYAEWLRENNLDANTEVSTLGDQLFGRFTAAAHAYADEYERKFGQQLQDDMGILKR
ncbi:hypothetical protein BJX63DRAFT_426417 [Aspergillus granulosus]|uniref:Uncharacterized protein n=1 Tax=Aspergillus granulosus TaxID=176169 RepID=A0ABR4GS99_9EURO